MQLEVVEAMPAEFETFVYHKIYAPWFGLHPGAICLLTYILTNAQQADDSETDAAIDSALNNIIRRSGLIDWLSMVLRLRQHNIGYTADGFYRSDDPTNSVKALKEGS